MVLKRTRSQSMRKGGYKRRRAMRRRVPRLLRPKNAVMSLRRRYWAYSWTPGTAATVDFYRNNNITLASIPNVSEITAMFDFYRIRAIKFTWMPRFSNFSGNNTTDTIAPGITNAPQLFATLCYDNRSSVIAPTGTYSSATYNSFVEQDKIKFVRNTNRPFSLYNRPTVISEVAQVSSGQYIKSPWLSTQNVGTNHFIGYIFVHDANFSASGFGNQSFDCFVTVYLQVKGLK